MKTFAPVIGIFVAACLLVFLIFSKKSVEIGMSRAEVYEIVDPENLLNTLESFSDTLVVVMPDVWGVGQAGTYALIFSNDTLAAFEKLKSYHGDRPQ